MKVSIKRFNVKMEIKNAGIELEVRDTDDQHLGDLVITKAKVIWCPGRTPPANGCALTWDRFVEVMVSASRGR